MFYSISCHATRLVAGGFTKPLKKLVLSLLLCFSLRAAVTYPTPDYVYPPDVRYFNVKSAPYSCAGDGVTDDTSCIKAAMDAAMKASGTGYGGRHGTVYFPSGTYLISDTLLWATYGNNNAIVTANVDTTNHCLTGFNIVQAGSGYGPSAARHGETNPGPSLYITGGGGSGVEYYTTINGSGGVAGFFSGLGNEGTSCFGRGYTSAPTVKVLNWNAYLRFEGQNKANTTIKLTDNNPKFQNANCNVSPHGDTAAREYCRAVILTGNEQSSSSTSIGESAYEDDIWNLTINTGSGNPGAIGIDWVGSNRASIKNVNIVSGSNQGRCGLSVSRSSSAGTGPDYAKNISINGFDYGIYAVEGANEVANTFEFIDLTNIHTYGVVNGAMPNWFRQVSANISVPVFVNQGNGSLLVVDGTFTNGASNATAIRAPATSSGGVVFLRNITTTGYQAALATGSGNVVTPGANISEYAFPATASQFASATTSLNLPNIPNTPEYMDSNFANWANVSSFGANCTPNSGQDGTDCIQAAMNSGKPIVYFPFGGYKASATIHIPSTVRAVLGMNSFFQQTQTPAAYCTFSFDGNGSNPIEFRNMSFSITTQSNTFCLNGAAPVVIADILNGVNITSSAASSGMIYLENVAVPNGNFNLRPTQQVFARQYDVESGTQTHVTSNGGIWWMFGFKSEGAGLLWNVSNATFELLGAFGTTAGGPSANPAFVMNNVAFSLAGISEKANGWTTAVRETKSGVTRNLAPNGLWLGGIGYGLYSGSAPTPVATTYYVSSSTGSDSNSGTDSGHPWRTVGKVSAPGITYRPGDFILFKCGDAWTQGTANFTAALTTPNSGLSGNPITYGHYVTSGTCTTLPILDANGALDPAMRITKDNVTVDGLWFKNAQQPVGDLLDYGGSTNIQILNNTFTDTGWAAIISETQLNTTALIDGNTCNASSGHVQLGGCVKVQGPSTTTVTHNLSDMRNLDTVNSGANCIHFEVSGSSNSRIDSNTMYGGTQGVSFKPGSCPAGAQPGVGNCYIAKVSGGSMSDNYINGVKKFGSATHTTGQDTCTGTPVGDGEAIELEGHPSPFTSGGVTLADVSQSGVTVARNIIIGAIGTTGVTGNHVCSGDTLDAIGTYYSSAFIYGNIIIGPVGTSNFVHFGGRDTASNTPSLFYNNTFVQDPSLSLRSGTAINNQNNGAGFGQYRNNIFVGFPKVYCCANTGTSSEDYSILFNNTSASTGVTIGANTRTVDPKFVLTSGHYRTAEDVKLQDIVSPAIGTGQAQLAAYANILSSQPTSYPYGIYTQGPLWQVGAFGPNAGSAGASPETIVGAKITGAIIQ